MTSAEIWAAVNDILERQPEETLDDAVHRCIREKRSGSWAARRILQYSRHPGSAATGRWLLYDIAKRGKFMVKGNGVLKP